MAEFEDNLSKTPVYLNQESKKWDRVYVKGKWDNSKQILVDNVINRGIAGYKVLTPLRIIETNQLILVDRGWIKQNKYREILPNIELIQADEVVSGILEYPELGLISKEYDEFIYPMILLADPILKNSLEYIKITPTNMTPTKHYGYSAQWFLMFLVLCLMYLWYGFKKNEK